MAYKQSYTQALRYNPVDYSMVINPSGKGISIGMPCPTNGIGWYMHGHAPKFRNVTSNNPALANKNYTMKNPPSIKCPLIVNGNMVPNFPSYLGYDNGGVGVYTNGNHTPFNMSFPSSMFCGQVARPVRAKQFTGLGNTHTTATKTKHPYIRIGDAILGRVALSDVTLSMGGVTGKTLDTLTLTIPRLTATDISSATSRSGAFGEVNHTVEYYTHCKVLGMCVGYSNDGLIPISIAQANDTTFSVTVRVYCNYKDTHSSIAMGSWTAKCILSPILTVLYYGDDKPNTSTSTATEDTTGVTRIGTINNARSSSNKNALYFSNASCGSPIGMTGYSKSGTGGAFVEVTNTSNVKSKETELGFGVTTNNAIGYEENGYWAVQNELRVNHMRISDSVFRSGTFNLTRLSNGNIGWSRNCKDVFSTSPINDEYHGTFQGVKTGTASNADLRADAFETVTWKDTSTSPATTRSTTKLKSAYARSNSNGSAHNNVACATNLRQTTDHESWTSMEAQNFEV